MNTEKHMRGVYAIPPTPFNEDLTVDVGGVKSIVDFCVAAGGHGIVAPVNASECVLLSDDERKLVVETIAKQNNKRIPYVAGVAGVTTPVAAAFAKHAAEAGADAVIAMPPYILKYGESDIIKYYEAISKAANIPVFIQNYPAPLGTPLSAKTLVKLIAEIPHVDYIKEETPWSGHVISEVVELAKALPEGKYKGVMGGKAGRFLLDEYRRGATGTMPACEVCDAHVNLWESLEAGDWEAAGDKFNRMLPLLNFESAYGSTLYKMVLKHRGVIANWYTREGASCYMDDIDMVEFDRVMAHIKPLFRI